MVIASAPTKSISRCIFDAGDVDLILSRFGLKELRQQIHAAEINEAVSRNFGEDDTALFFSDLRSALQLALDVLVSRRPKPTPRPERQRIDVGKVKAHADIVEIANRYTALKKSGQNFKGLCPLHADHRTASFVVYPKQQRWWCYGACSTGGDVIALVMAAEHLHFRDAVEVLAR